MTDNRIETGFPKYLLPAGFMEQPDNKKKYTQFTLPSLEGRSKINPGEFAGWLLKQAVIPDSITEIGEGAFCGCLELETVVLSGAVTRISNSAFAGCRKLNRIVLPGKVQEIGAYAFQNCVSLEEVTVCAGNIQICSHAFDGCALLRYVKPNAGICEKEGKGSAFQGCFSLRREKEDTLFEKSVQNGLKLSFDKVTMSAAVTAYAGREPIVRIPEVVDNKYVVTRIAGNAFCGNSTVTSLEIPDSVTQVEKGAFENCSSLARISFPGVLTDDLQGGSSEDRLKNGYRRCAQENETIDFGDLAVDAAYGKPGHLVFREGLTGKVRFGNEEFTDPLYGQVKDGWCRIRKNRAVSLPDNLFRGCISLKTIRLLENAGTLGKGMFEGCVSLEAAVLPRHIHAVPERFFSGCRNLRDVTMELAKEIGREAFLGCVSMENAFITKDTQILREGAFRECAGIRFLRLPASLSQIGEKAFFSCPQLRSVFFEQEETKVQADAFSGCAKLSTVGIPGSCAGIDESAFAQCPALRHVILDDNTKTVGRRELLFCSNLVSVQLGKGRFPSFEKDVYGLLRNMTLYIDEQDEDEFRKQLPEELKGIKLEGSEAADRFVYFQEEEGVCISKYLGAEEKVVIPETLLGKAVKCIGSHAFDQCVSVREIVLPELLEEIKDYAFCGCTGLTYMVLPENVKTIGKGVFEGCQGLRGVRAAGELEARVEEELYLGSGCRFLTTGKGALRQRQEGVRFGVFPIPWFPESDFTYRLEEGAAVIEGYQSSGRPTVLIPEFIDGYPVIKIGDYAFSNIREMEQAVFPQTLRELGEGAFYHCPNLKKIVLPETIEKAGAHCFGGCISLTECNCRAEHIRFGRSAFCGCGQLTAVCIQGKFVDAEEGLFEECPNLREIYSRGPEAEFGTGFMDALEGRLLYTKKQDGLPTISYPFSYRVQDNGESIEILTYQGEEEQADLPAYIEGLPLAKLCERAFENKIALTHIYLPGTIRELGEGAFSGCIRLREAQVPPDVKQISARLFYDCDRLESLSLPPGLEEIGEKSFSGCAGLKRLTLPGRVRFIGDEAFSGCRQLAWVCLPGSLEHLGRRAFSNCSSLRHLMLPKGIAGMPAEELEGCDNLRSVLFMNSGASLSLPAAKAAGLARIESVGICGELAEEQDGFVYYFNKKTGEAAILSCSLDTEEIQIPKYVCGFPVTGIGDAAFAWNRKTKRVVIPENVRRIGSMAFYRCGALEEICLEHETDFPVLYEECFFVNEKALIYVKTPEMKPLFRQNNCIQKVFATQDRIGDLEYRFDYKTGEMSVQTDKGGEIPDYRQVQKRPWDSAAHKIRSLSLTGGIRRIGSNAFAGCRALEDIRFEDGLAVIGSSAFEGCTGLVRISLPDSLEKLEDRAFRSCYHLKSTREETLLFPESLKEIGKSAFEDCAGIQYLRIGAQVNILKKYCFKYCAALSRVYLEHKSRPAFVGAGAFSEAAPGCEISVRFTDAGPVRDSAGKDSVIRTPLTGICGKGQNGQAFGNVRWKLYYDGILEIEGEGEMQDYDGATPPWYEYVEVIKEVAMKGDITHIGSMAFYSCGFERIQLPHGLRSIGVQAFAYCRNLKKLLIPRSIREIEAQAFRGCSGLDTVLFVENAYHYRLQGDVFSEISQNAVFYIPDPVQRQWMAGYYPKIACRNIRASRPFADTESDACFFACLYTDGLLVIDSDKSASLKTVPSCLRNGTKSLLITPAVERIGIEALQDMSDLKTVILCAEIKNIEKGAFDQLPHDAVFRTQNEAAKKALHDCGIPYGRVAPL